MFNPVVGMVPSPPLFSKNSLHFGESAWFWLSARTLFSGGQEKSPLPRNAPLFNGILASEDCTPSQNHYSIFGFNVSFGHAFLRKAFAEGPCFLFPGNFFCPVSAVLGHAIFVPQPFFSSARAPAE